MKAPERKPLKLGLDLIYAKDLQTALAKCAALGYSEELSSIPQHATAAELVAYLGCVGWRLGHKRFLRSAYEAGRFSAEAFLRAH
jgi:hypothetical protein